MKILAALLIVALAFAVSIGFSRDRQKAGAIAKLEDERDSLVVLTARAETLYVTDTIRLTSTRRTTDTILAHVTDTLIHRDTVVQIVERERRACDSALSSCSLLVQAITAERDNALEQRDTLLSLQPSRWDKTRTAGTWAAVGAVLALIFAR